MKQEPAKHQPLFSLIIPVYNVAPYLRACLDSVRAQTYPIDEILVVDDGSTDACPEILAEYAAQMPQLRIIRQANAGLSVARNVGLEQARGRYVAFLDSDDFVYPNMYEQLLKQAQQEQLDIVLCNAFYHVQGQDEDRLIDAEAYTQTLPKTVLSGADYMQHRLSHDRLLHMVWTQLYRRDFLQQHALRFIPGLIHEDVIWTTRALLAAKRVQYLASPFYFYRIVPGRFSAAQKQARLPGLIRSSLINSKTLLAIAEQTEGSKLFKQLLSAQAIDSANALFHKIKQLAKREEQSQYYQEIQRERLFPQLWAHAQSWRQKRQIARHYLRSFYCLTLGQHQ